RAVSTHGHAGDALAQAPRTNAILALDERHEFLEKEVAVADLASISSRIDVKAAPTLRSDDEEVADLALLAKIFNQLPGAGVDERLLVVAETMEEVEDGMFFCRLSVVPRRQQHAV